MMASKYKPGDKVFAKVRGYPYWPARVDACADETPNKMKYHVYFYGTAETAICKAEELAPYMENKDKYGKPLKRKGFNEGLQQIELEISGGVAVPFNFTDSVGDDDNDDNDNSTFHDENSSNASLSGGLVEKKKKSTILKRKRDSMDSLSEDAELKRKHARLSLTTGQASVSGSLPVDGDSPNSKIKAVSRSGRKIKPKKFADEDDLGDIGDSLFVGNGISSNSDVPGSSSSIQQNLASMTDMSINKVRKSQGSSRSNSLLPHPSSDENSKTVGDGHVGISSENPNRAILARALTGHYVKIKLDDERPAYFQDEKARQLWDAATARNAERLKHRIELGEYVPETIRKHLEGKADLTDAQKKEMKKETELARKRGKLRWLKQEAHLLELDAQIRSSLSLAKADTQRCLTLMDDMISVNIDPLMLKKHPNIVDTVKKLQKYIGNISKWNFSEDEMEKFKASCEQIRTKATHMYNKFKKLFAVPANKSFWNVFSQEVARFNQAVKHMSRDKMYALVVDPDKFNTVDDSDDEKESPRKRSIKSPKLKQPSNNDEDVRTETESAS